MSVLETQLEAVKILTLGLVRGSVWAVGRFVVCENVYSRVPSISRLAALQETPSISRLAALHSKNSKTIQEYYIDGELNCKYIYGETAVFSMHPL